MHTQIPRVCILPYRIAIQFLHYLSVLVDKVIDGQTILRVVCTGVVRNDPAG